LNSKTLITLEGSIERISFHNEEDHFTIARMKIKGQRDTIPVIGHLFSVTPGEVLKITGYYEQHPKYGLQVRIENYESLIPATVGGIEKYLGSGLVKGIGPEMAKRIVKKFGLKTLDIIEKDIRQLSTVDGVGPKRIAQIKEAWKEQKEIRRIMIFLQGYGVSTGLATKIFKTYGQQAVTRIQENPYCLAADIFGVGFLTADRIAQKMGEEIRSVSPGVLNDFQFLSGRVVRLLFHEENFGVTQNGLKQVVEVVGDASRKGADGLHFLSLEELPLKLLLFGNVPDDTLVAKYCAIFIQSHRCSEQALDCRTVFFSKAELIVF